MANTVQAQKRAKQAENRRQHNASFRSMVRTYLKKVVAAIETKDYAAATAAYVEAVPVIDRMADKGIIHSYSGNGYFHRPGFTDLYRIRN